MKRLNLTLIAVTTTLLGSSTACVTVGTTVITKPTPGGDETCHEKGDMWRPTIWCTVDDHIAKKC